MTSVIPAKCCSRIYFCIPFRGARAFTSVTMPMHVCTIGPIPLQPRYKASADYEMGFEVYEFEPQALSTIHQTPAVSRVALHSRRNYFWLRKIRHCLDQSWYYKESVGIYKMSR
jgi:hypothetical protein